MLRIRLDPEYHGTAGFTSISRLLAGAFAAAVLLLCVVMGSHVVFDGRIMPGVEVGDRPVGGYSLPLARARIAGLVKAFALQVNVEGRTYKADASQLGVSYDVAGTADAAYAAERQSILPWPAHRLSVALRYSLNAQQLDSFVNSVTTDISHPPTDASIQINDGQVAVVPAIAGMSIDKSALVKLIIQDIQDPSTMAIQPQVHVMPAQIQAASLTTTVAQTQKLVSTPIVMTYNGRTFSPTAAELGSWITFSKKENGLSYALTPEIDTNAVAAYVAGLAKKINVSPVSEEDFVASGTTKIIRVGRDGVAVDQSQVASVLAHAVSSGIALNYAIPTEAVAYGTQTTDLTPLDYAKYVEVNLTTQHLYLWQNGQVIYDSPLTSGATGAGFATVTGLFHIYYKTTNTHLVGYAYGPAYDYDVFVQYWMPFYEGYGLHDASWRNGNFGGPDYYYGGSHGCVNLPLATAAFLYGWSSVGTPVWVHN